MTRTEAIAIITAKLEAADDATLEAAVRHLSALAGEALTVDDVLECVVTDSVLPRPLTPRELELIEQSKEDFRLGRTYTIDEAETYIDAELARRRRQRAAE